MRKGTLKTYLGQSQLITTTEERTLALGIGEKGLDLLYSGSNQCLGGGIALFLRSCPDTGKEVRDDLAEEGIDEECDAGTVQSVIGGIGRREEVGWVGVGNELGNNARLGNDVSVI